MSTRLLYKAFFGRRYAPIVGVTLAICGLYGGYLLWFICQRYLPGPDAAAWHLAFLIGWMLCSFLSLGRIPDALFTNRRLCAVRWVTCCFCKVGSSRSFSGDFSCMRRAAARHCSV